MESSESEEPEKKRTHLNSPLSPTMARNSSTSPPDNKSVKISLPFSISVSIHDCLLISVCSINFL